uniref:Serpin domain-containing protein n=1 Tax=Panagrolaimus davidi TaxID=227884 RepID=A0A914RA87_9BILA
MQAPPVFATATLPVFEIESTTILNDKLKSLGITQLFGGNQNCFDKLFAKNNESSSHALDIFVHTAKFKTDQFGADGRDSTEDYLRYEDVRPQPGDISDDPRCPRIEFIADHPFIYFLALWGPGNHQSRKLELLSIQFAGIFS